MKFSTIALLAGALLTGGCVFVPSPYSAQLKPIAKRYNAIENGTPRSGVETQLGSPSRTEKDGSVVWETRVDELNYAMAKVWFDRENKVQKIEVTQAHGANHPGFYASAVGTQTK